MLNEIIIMSFKTLVTYKKRSFLTILGIVIGIASIISLATLTQGAINTVTGELNGLGGNMLNIRTVSSSSSVKNFFLESDYEELSSLNHFQSLSPATSAGKTLHYNGKSFKNISIEGRNESYFQENLKILKQGRGVSSIDVKNRSNVVVLGEDLKKNMFKSTNCIGSTILINNIDFTVIGVISRVGGMTMSVNTNLAILPYTTSIETLNFPQVKRIDLYFTLNSNMESNKIELSRLLFSMFSNNDDLYVITNNDRILDLVDTLTITMMALMIGISAISLLVGGIGIMNMMIVSVSERTNEIGLRKALGATPFNILLQFIVEAVVISFIGGIIGTALGAVLTLLLASIFKFEIAFNLFYILFALLFSGLIGLIFGIMPARSASKLKPIVALKRN